jgi:hypothetical protein
MDIMGHSELTEGLDLYGEEEMINQKGLKQCQSRSSVSRPCQSLFGGSFRNSQKSSDIFG